MTESLLQKLEDKVVILLSEFETLRMELAAAKRQNNSLLTEKSDSTRKLHELIALLDTAEMIEHASNADKTESQPASNGYASAV